MTNGMRVFSKTTQMAAGNGFNDLLDPALVKSWRTQADELRSQGLL
jgi:hypothetical protein